MFLKVLGMQHMQWVQYHVGYQQSYVDRGLSTAAAGANTKKTVAAAGGQFEADQYSVTMNVNDNLSVSYAKADDTYDAMAGAADSNYYW